MRHLFILIILLLNTILFAQDDESLELSPWTVGLHTGSTHFLGDVGGTSGGSRLFKDTDFESTSYEIGLQASYTLIPQLRASFQLNYLWLHADDAIRAPEDFDATAIPPANDSSWYRAYRNLDVRTRVWEYRLQVTILPLQGTWNPSRLSPYVKAGIGILNMDPQGRGPQNEWIHLSTLSTEGQGLTPLTGGNSYIRSVYRNTQFFIPLEAGIHWQLHPQWAVQLGFNYRVTFTDYLDDVSTAYIDPAIFDANFGQSTFQAELVKYMARKSIELDPGNVNGQLTSPGAARGNPDNHDQYYSLRIGIQYTLQKFAKDK